MKYEEMVQLILDKKLSEWDMLHNRLLFNYKDYYHSNILLNKDFIYYSDGQVYRYTFTLSSETLLELNKNLLNSQGILSNRSDNYNITIINISFTFDKYNKNIFYARANQVVSHNWIYISGISPSKNTYYYGENLILMRKLNTSHWSSYGWVLNLKLRNLYKDLNDYKSYKMLKDTAIYEVITDSKLSNYLKHIKRYWYKTNLCSLLENQDLILIKHSLYNDDHTLYVAIPDSQIQWNDYELMWVFNLSLNK